jgi:large subunit ribosomal protein L1
MAGLVSFSDEALADNIRAVYNSLIKLKPSTAKGTYIRNVAISSTQGPGVKIDPAGF